jgi:predicted metal-dependent HD superfamily phosphohydrolase
MQTVSLSQTQSKKRSTDILVAAKRFVEKYWFKNQQPAHLFHNLEHTREVVKVATKLARDCALNESERERVILAAWFQDLGFAKGAQEYRERSTALARAFLKEQGQEEAETWQVLALIGTTELNHEPQTEAEKVLHDATWSFLGRKRFFRLSKLLRQEKELLENEEYTPYEWHQKMLDWQLQHLFHTLPARAKYLNRKMVNIDKQREKTREAKIKYRRQKSGKDFGRGIDTLFRNTLRGHLNLSSIADGKANMIISINTLVLSILITAITAGSSFAEVDFYKNPRFMVPSVILMIGSLTAIVFAVLSAIPRSSEVRIDRKKVQSREVSLLFFNNFLKVEKETFVDYLDGLKTNQEELYRNLGRDIYNLGSVLDKKYRLLSLSYKFFLAGLVLSFIAFLVMQAWYFGM